MLSVLVIATAPSHSTPAVPAGAPWAGTVAQGSRSCLPGRLRASLPFSATGAPALYPAPSASPALPHALLPPAVRRSCNPTRLGGVPKLQRFSDAAHPNH